MTDKRMEAGPVSGSGQEDGRTQHPKTEAAREHDPRCLYCEHGPWCPTCPPPAAIPEDAYVCGPCREEITRGEIAADPYYQGGEGML